MNRYWYFSLLGVWVTLVLTACAPALTAPTPTLAPPDPIRASTPQEAVQGFYDWYLEAWVYDPASNGPIPTRDDEAYQGSPYLTAELVRAKEEEYLSMVGPGGYDPFLCAQNWPEWVRVVEVNETGETAVAVVETSLFAGPQQRQTFNISLQKEGDTWLLSGIDCMTGEQVAVQQAEDRPQYADASGQWLIFHDDVYGYSLHYPAAWQFQEATIADPSSPVQRVIGFAPAGWAGMMMPVSIEISASQPAEMADGQAVTVNGYAARVQPTPYGEVFTIFEHPQNSGLYITLRDSTGMLELEDELLAAEMEAVAGQMVNSLSLE